MAEEKKIENSIKRYLDSIGAYYIKIHGSAFMASGTPDIVACVNGRFVAIEVKKEKGGVVSALQKAKINKINDCGGVAFVANSLQVVQDVLIREHII